MGKYELFESIQREIAEFMQDGTQAMLRSSNRRQIEETRRRFIGVQSSRFRNLHTIAGSLRNYGHRGVLIRQLMGAGRAIANAMEDRMASITKEPTHV